MQVSRERGQNSELTDDERLVVAHDVGMFELFPDDRQLVDDVTDALLSLLARLAPRRVQSTHLS